MMKATLEKVEDVALDKDLEEEGEESSMST